MQDITEEVSRYREAARHLWNTTFRAGPVSWDARDNFSRVASEMFSALVLDPLGSTENRLAEMFDPEPSHFQRIRVVPASEQIQILINRASKRMAIGTIQLIGCSVARRTSDSFVFSTGTSLANGTLSTLKCEL
jgi:hypothetical protein